MLLFSFLAGVIKCWFLYADILWLSEIITSSRAFWHSLCGLLSRGCCHLQIKASVFLLHFLSVSFSCLTTGLRCQATEREGQGRAVKVGVRRLRGMYVWKCHSQTYCLVQFMNVDNNKLIPGCLGWFHCNYWILSRRSYMWTKCWRTTEDPRIFLSVQIATIVSSYMIEVWVRTLTVIKRKWNLCVHMDMQMEFFYNLG